MRRNLGQLFTAIKGPDGPAFVVLNDDSSDRLPVRELNNIDKIMRQWMRTLWPDKVGWDSFLSNPLPPRATADKL